MSGFLMPFHVYCCHLIIDGKDHGLINAMLMEPSLNSHNLYAKPMSDSRAGFGFNDETLLYFSRYEGPTGDELFLVSPDELPDEITPDSLSSKPE